MCGNASPERATPRLFAYRGGTARVLVWVLPGAVPLLLGPILAALSLARHTPSVLAFGVGIFVCGAFTALGAVYTIGFWVRIWRFLDAIRQGVATNADGLKVPDWEGRGILEFAWPAVEGITLVHCGGICRPAIAILHAGGRRLQLPAWLEGRDELLDVIINEAELTVHSRSWWGIHHSRCSGDRAARARNGEGQGVV